MSLLATTRRRCTGITHAAGAVWLCVAVCGCVWLCVARAIGSRVVVLCCYNRRPKPLVLSLKVCASSRVVAIVGYSRGVFICGCPAGLTAVTRGMAQVEEDTYGRLAPAIERIEADPPLTHRQRIMARMTGEPRHSHDWSIARTHIYGPPQLRCLCRGTCCWATPFPTVRKTAGGGGTW